MAPSRPVALAEGLVADLAAREIRLAVTVCLREGWLEQLVCTPGTREHESIFVTDVRPSQVHAALLLLGLEPGTPGSWRMEGDRVVEVPPTGPPVEAYVQFAPLDGHDADADADGHLAGERVALAHLVHDMVSEKPIVAPFWRFAGSVLDEREELPPGVPRYAADWSGSVIGLVTFGDEVLALPAVRPDQVEVAPSEWAAWTSRIPPIGTEATIILRPLRAADRQSIDPQNRP